MEQNNIENQFQSESACAGSQFAQWFWWWAKIIKGGKIDTIVSVCKRPEAMSKAMDD